MTYFKEFASGLFLALLCLLIWDLDRSVSTVNAELPGILSNVKSASNSLPDTMNSVKQSADTANMVSTESLDLVGSANKLIDGLEVTNSKAGKLLDAGTDVLGKYGRTADVLSVRLDALAVTQAKADAAIDAYASIPAHVIPALDSANRELNSLNTVTDTAALLLSDPVIKGTFDSANVFLVKWGNFGDKAATMTGHIDKDFFAPYDGAHPKRHAAWQFTKGTLGLSTQVGEGAYYWKGVK